ncbi:hypothetical protein OM076_08015 [Solirubrobacter ginsenosidimutans]|uniref:Uncharacterized protein n=1 Tax=Solirubrobacter ginsenosidimutans TaxID=490573 RepID=A0A9X3MPD6_9ACTN|nr:hypothetical protein [Solirubrobacter ginsenosidimutans]MDA0160204.1 hypothetical protein [Solirubrobacter ginsenosidimutans]
MIADRRFAARQKLHRSPAVAVTHCRERRATHSVSRLPLAVDSFEGDTLGGDELQRVKESVVAALALGDHGYIQLVMADLRVKNPGGWTEIDRVLSDLRTFRHIPPRRPMPGLGSFRQRPAEIERNLHRFWAGGPMPETTKACLLAMQEVVAKSQDSGTPWTQYLWTRPGVDAVEELAGAGIQIVEVDDQWPAERVRLFSVRTYGGVYMDAGIGPGTLNLSNHQLYHTDPDGVVGHHAPPFRRAWDLHHTIADASLGDSPRERIARRADASLPIVDTFLASRRGTRRLAAALAALAEPGAKTAFSRLFVPVGEHVRTTYAPPQQRVTPWAADLAWFQAT